MYFLLKYYIFLVSITLCKKHYIIETEPEAEDDIQTDIKPLYNRSNSGDYSAQNDCDGVRLTCKAKNTRSIMEGSCYFT